jgi:hypothetical protein
MLMKKALKIPLFLSGFSLSISAEEAEKLAAVANASFGEHTPNVETPTPPLSIGDTAKYDMTKIVIPENPVSSAVNPAVLKPKPTPGGDADWESIAIGVLAVVGGLLLIGLIIALVV